MWCNTSSSPPVLQTCSFSCLHSRSRTKLRSYIKKLSRRTSSVRPLPTVLASMSPTSTIISDTPCVTSAEMAFIGTPWPIAALRPCCCGTLRKRGEWCCPVQWALKVRKWISIYFFALGFCVLKKHILMITYTIFFFVSFFSLWIFSLSIPQRVERQMGLWMDSATDLWKTPWPLNILVSKEFLSHFSARLALTPYGGRSSLQDLNEPTAGTLGPFTVEMLGSQVMLLFQAPH